ncbi:SseB family protein [Stackebrandtia nassauensis]|nr:SseB family protein [Stackebrandtia nassauensis]
MWVPANDIEQHMREALRAGNQEEYFRLLARTDLLLPFAEDTSPSSNGTGSWATWATEDRTHVLVFTSPEAMRACLHAHAGAFRTVSFTALADAWPDSDWWLAVDPGTPIEGYLPAWFVRQVASGDTHLPDDQAPHSQPPMYAANDYPPPRTDYPQSAPPSQFGQFEAAPPPPQFGQFEASPFQQAPPPDPGPRYGETAPSAPSAGPGGLPRREPAAASPAPEPFSQQPADPYDAGLPQRDAYGQPSEAFNSGLPQRDSYPPAEAPPVQDPPSGTYDSPMSSAMPRREPMDSGFGQQPEPEQPAWEPAPRPEEPAWQAQQTQQPASDGYSAASRLPVPVSTALPEWPSEDAVEDELALAASTGDTKAYLSVLLRAWAYLPVAEDCPPSARPGDPEFRWHTDLIDGAYTITAFTSLSRLIARYGDRPHINTTFGRLTAQWPGLEYSLYVNPSTEVGANVPGPQVTTLVTWARTQGLLQPALDMDALGAPRSPASNHGSAQTQAPPPPQAQAPEPAAATPAPTAPELMQKVLPHQQVAMTLERGYDRVAGFVHRYNEVADLNTPEQLYNALGLLRDGVDFSPTDESVHVIRWVGHRGDLYRIAYGGNDPATAERNGGWIVEPPPFSGDGYAPSVEGRRIVEYKVDSVRLPHGATMTRVSADGRSEDIAVYDSDRREWIRADIEAAASSWDISPAGDFRQEQQHA